MSSSDRLNPQQLRMFIPAGELKANVYPPDVDQEKYYGNNQKQMWADKLSETKATAPSDAELERIGSTATSIWDVVDALTHGAGLHEKIKAQGVQRPVQLLPAEKRGQPTNILFDGHHRVAAAADIDPKMEVPVTYISMSGARDTGRVK
jgi:uncharacterized ParB-like nuclease family protein